MVSDWVDYEMMTVEYEFREIFLQP